MPKPMLDVGVRSYTLINRKIVKEPYTSIDIDPFRNPDIVGDVTDTDFMRTLPLYKSVLFNGIIQFGVNNRQQLKISIQNFFNILEIEGVLVIGWNEWNFRRKEIDEIATKIGFHRSLLFKRKVYEPYYSDNKHYYSMWRKI